MTANDLIGRSLRLIGKLGEGETPSAQAAQDARSMLNDMLDQWQADGIMVFAEKETTHDLTSGSSSYTIGVTDIVTGTADSGSTTTMVDAARTEAEDFWNGKSIIFTSGALNGLSRLITDFVAATDTLTFSPALPSAVGTNTYRIVNAGDWVQDRPVRILRANVIPDSTSADPIQIPIRVNTPQQWAAIRQKGTESAYPYGIYYDKRMDRSSFGTVFTYPIPTNTNAQILIWTEDLLNQFTDLVTDFTFPPGYALALRQNLAVLLAPEYGLDAPQSLMRQADMSLAVIQRTNSDDEQLIVDSALWKISGGYNILTDEG